MRLDPSIKQARPGNNGESALVEGSPERPYLMQGATQTPAGMTQIYLEGKFSATRLRTILKSLREVLKHPERDKLYFCDLCGSHATEIMVVSQRPDKYAITQVSVRMCYFCGREVARAGGFGKEQGGRG